MIGVILISNRGGTVNTGSWRGGMPEPPRFRDRHAFSCPKRLARSRRLLCLAAFLAGVGLVPVIGLVPSSARASTGCALGVSVCATGFNADGELGDGSLTNSNTFVSVVNEPATPVRGIAAGYDDSLVVAANGSVWAWGNDQSGQLGNGKTSSSSKPVPVSGLGIGSGIVAVASAGAGTYSLALEADGTVLAWGDNSQGELGTGNFADDLTPTPVVGLGPGSGVVAIAAGVESLALKADGAVLAWGGSASLTKPSQVSGLGPGSGVTAISSYGTSMALKRDGSVWAWGLNSFGQLGDGTTQSSDTPVQVSGLGAGSGVVAIAAGQLHSMALKSDGAVLAWGYGGDGELGTGNTDGSLIPIQVPGLGPGSGAVRIAAGGGDSFAIEKSGSVLAWGNNVYGELGDGTATAFIYSPETVGELPNPQTDIAVGYYHTLLAPAAARPPHTIDYVAMGDSYSSGEGNPPFDPGTADAATTDTCHRSSRAWPRVLAGTDRHLELLDLIACSGATTADLVRTFKSEPSQIARLKDLKPRAGAIVTITIGGNDVGFAPAFTDCYFHNCWRDGALAALISKIRNKLPRKLAAVFKAIGKSVPPRTRIIVVGYPNIITTSIRKGIEHCAAWLNPLEREEMVAAATDLDRVERKAASAAGLGYVSTLHVLAGHELCTAHSWVKSVNVLKALSSQTRQQFAHPTSPGQGAIAKAVARYLNSKH